MKFTKDDIIEWVLGFIVLAGIFCTMVMLG